MVTNTTRRSDRNTSYRIPERAGLRRWLALGAVAGPVLFTGAWVVLENLNRGYTLWDTHIAPYRPLSQPISGLGLGSTGPYMNAAFIGGGLTLLAGVIATFQCIKEHDGLAIRRDTVLMAITPIGMVMCGIFTLESMMLHSLGFVLAAATPVVSFLVTGRTLRRVPRWHRFGNLLIAASPITLALLVLFFLTFSPTVEGAESGIAGLTQRILVTEMLAWFVALGWRAFRGI